jgi:hypothetical protein
MSHFKIWYLFKSVTFSTEMFAVFFQTQLLSYHVHPFTWREKKNGYCRVLWFCIHSTRPGLPPSPTHPSPNSIPNPSPHPVVLVSPQPQVSTAYNTGFYFLNLTPDLCLVVSCRAVSCRVVSRRVVSCRVVPCRRALSCRVLVSSFFI